jgi:hypothetical protein
LLEGFSLHANTHLHANDRQGCPWRYSHSQWPALQQSRSSPQPAAPSGQEEAQEEALLYFREKSPLQM